MTVREQLPAPDRSRRLGPLDEVGQRPDPLPGPSDAVPARAAAVPGEVGRRCQAPAGEDVQRGVGGTGGAVREPSHLGTCGPADRGKTPQPPGCFSGIPPSARRGGRAPGQRCRHIRGLGRAEPGDTGAGRVYTGGRAGVSRGLPGAGGSAQGLRETCRA